MIDWNFQLLSVPLSPFVAVLKYHFSEDTAGQTGSSVGRRLYSNRWLLGFNSLSPLSHRTKPNHIGELRDAHSLIDFTCIFWKVKESLSHFV